jgi:plasmid stabilization system protein ParE
MRLIYHPEAEAELVDAAEYYEERLPGLGAEFLDAVDAAVNVVLSDPLRAALCSQGIRRHLLKRFPYALYYRVGAEEIRVLAVKHHSRHPDYWKHR